jgi:NOL1/NOP2/fmu family ribosome biogenesis protein
MPSKLCFADKLSLKYDPWWFYLPRAWLSGELFEYRERAARNGFVSREKTHREWFRWAYEIMITVGTSQKADAAPYSN